MVSWHGSRQCSVFATESIRITSRSSRLWLPSATYAPRDPASVSRSRTRTGVPTVAGTRTFRLSGPRSDPVRARSSTCAPPASRQARSSAPDLPYHHDRCPAPHGAGHRSFAVLRYCAEVTTLDGFSHVGLDGDVLRIAIATAANGTA